MKKLIIIITTILCVITYRNVYAKDTVYTINKYNEEELDYITKSYTNNKEDGYVVAGRFLKEIIEEENELLKNSQILLLKYNKKGNILWKYEYGNTSNDTLYYLTYSYNDSKNINGYILVVSKTYDIEKEEVNDLSFLLINEKGKLVLEKDLEISGIKKITKVINSYSEDKVDGYIVIGSVEREEKERAIIAKYNLDYEKEWEKEYNPPETETVIAKDIITMKNSEEEQELVGIVSISKENETSYQLVRFDNNGDMLSLVYDEFEPKDSPSLLKIDNSYIVYGKTSKVKLEKNKSSSYYLTKYNDSDKIDWETVGNIAIDSKKIIELQSYNDKFLLMYTNGNDQSIELVKINKDGLVENKIKKINNEYYNINSFLYNENTIYFVGQIKCPKDEVCDFKENSLFLISDKDRVIEVKDNDSKIVIVTLVIVIATIVLIFIRKKRKKK